MDRWQATGLVFALTSGALGTIGLLNSKPLPPSAHLGRLAPLDKNDDGRLSASEWRAAGRDAGRMRIMDGNGNGFLEPTEIRPRRTAGEGAE